MSKRRKINPEKHRKMAKKKMKIYDKIENLKQNYKQQCQRDELIHFRYAFL